MRGLKRLAALAALAMALPALAGPLADVGDRQMRQDIDLLKAAGLIRGPVDSWPMAWPQIDAALDAAHDGRVLDPWVRAAVDRLDRLSAHAAQRVAYDARIDATNNVSVARDFGELARADGDAAASAEFNTSVVSVRAGVGLRSGQTGNAYNFEPTQITIRLDNWALYAGYTQEYWGPGMDGALLFSNNTRPFPKIGVKRLMPDPINLPVLRWLGPIRLDFFGGVLNEQRDFRNVITFGTRISFAPTRHLEIGLNRAQMLCGEGRPCGGKQFLNSFIGVGNADNPPPGSEVGFNNQAGNQLAGFDLSYRQNFGAIATKLYFEAEAEDSQHIIIEQFGRLMGLNVSGPWGSRGAYWTANVEYADTQAAQFFNGTPLANITGSKLIYANSFYNNSLYTSGFTYNALPIGYWTDGDARNLILQGAVTDNRNRRWYASVQSVHLNLHNLGNPPAAIFPRPDGSPGPLISSRVSTDSEKFAIVTAGAEVPTRFGDVRLEARYQSDSPSTPGRTVPRAAIEVQLRQRF